ncbi:MAG: hypothetical protein AAFM91_07990 [Pseudomonadota bacterium]
MDLRFIVIPAGRATLGWHFDDVLSVEAAHAINEFFGDSGDFDFRSELFSPCRKVDIETFAIADESYPWAKLIAESEGIKNLESLDLACAEIDRRLRETGLRLPSEDEFEFAIGGGMFAWGDEMPDGVPYEKATNFTGHKERTQNGLLPNPNTYATELVTGYFKFGDGGVSVCGGEPWPMAWLSLSPAFRVQPELYEHCLVEYLEGTLIRPVRCA